MRQEHAESTQPQLIGEVGAWIQVRRGGGGRKEERNPREDQRKEKDMTNKTQGKKQRSNSLGDNTGRAPAPPPAPAPLSAATLPLGTASPWTSVRDDPRVKGGEHLSRAHRAQIRAGHQPPPPGYRVYKSEQGLVSVRPTSIRQPLRGAKRSAAAPFDDPNNFGVSPYSLLVASRGQRAAAGGDSNEHSRGAVAEAAAGAQGRKEQQEQQEKRPRKGRGNENGAGHNLVNAAKQNSSMRGIATPRSGHHPHQRGARNRRSGGNAAAGNDDDPFLERSVAVRYHNAKDLPPDHPFFEFRRNPERADRLRRQETQPGFWDLDF
jgi:hypothetical protein